MYMLPSHPGPARSASLNTWNYVYFVNKDIKEGPNQENQRTCHSLGSWTETTPQETQSEKPQQLHRVCMYFMS